MKRVVSGVFLIGSIAFLRAQQPVQLQQGTTQVTVTGSNALKVDNSAVTQPVSGTVAATQGTSPWIDSITTWASGTLGAMANYGASPGAVLVPGVNAFITNTPNVNITATDSTASGAVGSLNANVQVPMVGDASVSFVLPAGNNLVATLTPQFSSDGGTTWNATYLRTAVTSTNWVVTLAANSTAGTFNILVPGGSGLVRIIATAYTSGSATISMRATVQPEQVWGTQGSPGTAAPPIVSQIGGSDGANLRTVSTDANGKVKVDLFGNAGAVVDGAPGSAVPANALQIAGTDGTNTIVPYIDPCQRGARTPFNINQTANTRLIVGASSKKTWLCNLWIAPIGTATNIAFVEGTGSTCGTGTISISGLGGGGSGTAATGSIMVANEGFNGGNGAAWVSATTVNTDDLCLFQSAANQVSGGGSYVQY